MSLSPLLIVVVVLVIALGAASKLIQLPTSRTPGAQSYPYYGKKTLFSAAERSFLGVLEQATDGRYRVYGKVRLADALGIKSGTSPGERQRALNRVVAKHVDFVLCHPQNLEIAALIELDDASHKRADRKARDAFLEKACAAAGVQLLRFPAREHYSLSYVRAGLASLDAVNGPSPTPPTTPSTNTCRPTAID